MTQRLTCKQALQARYSVEGTTINGIHQYAPSLSFDEAQRFYDFLVERDYDVKVKPIGAYRQ